MVRTTLHRLMSEDLPIIGRDAPGVYWRQFSPADRRYGHPPVLTDNFVAVYCPLGSGYASWSALLAIGWCKQVPARHLVAVSRRNLKMPTPLGQPTLKFIERHNRRRRELNWSEVTLLEAAKCHGPVDYHRWDHAMERLTTNKTWLLPAAPVSKTKLLWAAETEPAAKKWPAGQGDNSFDAVMARLQADMPETIDTL